MGRGAWARRWVAASGGVLVNGLILGALTLIKEPAPRIEEQPVIILALERPERRRAPPRTTSSAPMPIASPASADPEPSEPMIADALPGGTPPPAAPPDIDPQWRIEQKTIERWTLTEGVPASNWGRYYRACKGLSNEHMTPDEKERCYGGNDRPANRRPSQGFIGPIDEKRWQVPEPKTASRYDAAGARKQRCRDNRRGRTPGFSERNLASTGAPPPSLREGGCF